MIYISKYNTLLSYSITSLTPC